MRRPSLIFIAILTSAALLLSACAQPAPAPQPTPAQAAQAPTAAPAAARTITIGFTASQTGSLNVEGTRQINGLNLCIEQVNAAGGIKLADGSVAQLQAKFYDDESKKERVQELYTRLINEDKADFLISPYSSGLADAAAVIAEQNGKIMITAGAASDSTHAKGYNLVFQMYTPASRYLTGAFDLLAKLAPNAKKVAIIHENDKFSTDVSNAARDYGVSKGFNIVTYEGYDTGTTDFAPFINKIPADVEAIMGGGHFADGSTFAKQLFEKGVKAGFIALLVAPPEPKFAEIGPGAEGVIGPSQWEPQAKYTAEAAKAAGLTWVGPSGEEFVAAYKAKYKNEDPSYHSAGGYAACLILKQAIEKAGSVDTQKVKAALDATGVMSFFGPTKFDTAKAHGLQIGHDMVYIQWQKGADGKLVKQVVWPAAGKSADAKYPLR
ncbi:MAG: amino acid ABC transporter substrate-binding protein [Anaerolineae bacterium]